MAYFNTDPEADAIKQKYICQSWLRSNLIYLGLGILIGIVLSLLISAFNGEWIGTRGVIFQMLYSTIISLCITNCIYVSQKVLFFVKKRFWAYITIYYTSSILGMLIAIELIYLVQTWLYQKPYHFFHLQDTLFSTIVVLIICTVIFFYYAQKERMDARLKQKDLDVLRLNQMKTQAQLATLQSKINPHFLYNSLNAIASLIHEDPDKAESMTLKLSKLFRYSINQTQDDLVPLQEEMEIVSTYLDIEKVRFGDRINFQTRIAEDVMKVKIPRFLIQPLVENALKHGLNNLTKDGLLTIDIRKTDQLLISICDNGSPFPTELDMGYGLQSTYDKLELLFPGHHEIQILNQPVKQIQIQIPLIYG
jgi:two-component system LytT family sensor kinase